MKTIKTTYIGGGSKTWARMFATDLEFTAAGGRHPVEFMNNSWYIRNNGDIDGQLFRSTAVDHRKIERLRKW